MGLVIRVTRHLLGNLFPLEQMSYVSEPKDPPNLKDALAHVSSDTVSCVIFSNHFPTGAELLPGTEDDGPVDLGTVLG